MSDKITARLQMEMALAAEREIVEQDRATLRALRRAIRPPSERVNNRRDCEQHPHVEAIDDRHGMNEGSLDGTACVSRVRRRRPLLATLPNGPQHVATVSCGAPATWAVRVDAAAPRVGMCLQHAGQWARRGSDS